MSIFCWDFDGTLAYCNHLWSGSVFRALNETVADHTVTFQDIRRCNTSGFTWHTPDEDFTEFVGEKWWEFMNAHFFRSFVSLGIDEKQAKIASEKVREIIMLPSNYNLFDDTVHLNCADRAGNSTGVPFGCKKTGNMWEGNLVNLISSSFDFSCPMFNGCDCTGICHCQFVGTRYAQDHVF